MKTLFFTCLACIFLFFTSTLSAQILNPKNLLKKKAVDKTNQILNKRTDQVVDTVFNKTDRGVDTIIGGKKKIKKSDSNQVSQNNGNTDTTLNSSSNEHISLQSYSKYDFIPGEKVILFEDFSQDAIGDFPALWAANAPGEINSLNIAPGKWFNLNSTDGNYFLLKKIDFPKNFIIEFDIVPKKTGGRIAAGLLLYGETAAKEMDNNPHPGNSGIMISIEKEKWNTWAYKTGESSMITGSSNVNTVEAEKVNHVIIWVQNRRVRIYHKSAKVLDMPTNLYDGTILNRICFRLSRGASSGSFISNLRITDASPDMRSKLLTVGKLVSYGIYFDVNKDVVKPESYGTLKTIADVLNENPDVKIKIIGYTDADGADAFNLDLSKRRALAVKIELEQTFGINSLRIETDGEGELKPVAPNDSPSNKALNRRVELIKL